MQEANQKSDILLINRHFSDLNPIVAGQERCAPDHRFGPAVRRYTLLHCVLSGKGTYTCGGVTYPVTSGQIFRILPGEETVYMADSRDPWHYCWIGFDGRLSERMRGAAPGLPCIDSRYHGLPPRHRAVRRIRIRHRIQPVSPVRCAVFRAGTKLE